MPKIPMLLTENNTTRPTSKGLSGYLLLTLPVALPAAILANAASSLCRFERVVMTNESRLRPLALILNKFVILPYWLFLRSFLLHVFLRSPFMATFRFL